MPDFITHLDVSICPTEEQQLQAQCFKKIDLDLNEGSGGNNIYLWYKSGPRQNAITRLQFTFNDVMAVGLIDAGYTKVPKNLNAGVRGDCIYLWYLRGTTEFDTPIVEVTVTSSPDVEAPMFSFGWERLACDLNRQAFGNWIHAWVRREKQTYICDVAATDNFELDSDYFKRGYIRLDEDTNRGTGGAFVFTWYRQSTDPKRALTDLQVSTTTSEYQSLQQQDYKIVNVNLNQGTYGNDVYMWSKQDKADNPIKAMTLLINAEAFAAYERAGALVIKRNLNAGNKGWLEYLCVYLSV